jgi:hypothetical protein
VVPKQIRHWTGLYGYCTRSKLNFILRKYTAVFQAEVYAIKTCAAQYKRGDYRSKKYIYSVS